MSFTGGFLSPGISLDDTLAVREQVLYRELGSEAVLLDLKSGTYFGLDGVGARVWQLILEHGVLVRVLDALVEEYDADRESVERDLLALAAQLVARQLAAVKSHAG